MNKLVKRIATTLTASAFALTLCTFAVGANESGWLTVKVPAGGKWSPESALIKKTDNGRAGFFVITNPYAWGIYGQISSGGKHILASDTKLSTNDWTYAVYKKDKGKSLGVNGKSYRATIRCKSYDPGNNYVKYIQIEGGKYEVHI